MSRKDLLGKRVSAEHKVNQVQLRKEEVIVVVLIYLPS